MLGSRGQPGLSALMSSGWWLPQYAELIYLFIYLISFITLSVWNLLGVE